MTVGQDRVFTFDHVFGPTAQQVPFFALSGPLLASAYTSWLCGCVTFLPAFIPSFILPYFHSVICSFLHSSIHPSTHPSIHPSIQPTNHPPTHPTTQPLTHSLTHPPTHPPTHSLTHPPTNSPTQSLTHSLTSSPVTSPTHQQVGCKGTVRCACTKLCGKRAVSQLSQLLASAPWRYVVTVGEEEEGSSDMALPTGTVGATPAQVSQAVKVQNCLYVDVIIY